MEQVSRCCNTSVPKHCIDPAKLEAPQSSHSLYTLLSPRARRHSCVYSRPRLQRLVCCSKAQEKGSSTELPPLSPKIGTAARCQPLQQAPSPSPSTHKTVEDDKDSCHRKLICDSRATTDLGIEGQQQRALAVRPFPTSSSVWRLQRLLLFCSQNSCS